MTNIIFVDTLPHYIKSKELSKIIKYNSHFITTNIDIFKRIKLTNKTYLHKKNFLGLFFFIIKMRKRGDVSVTIARTDSLIFQLLYKFCYIKEIFTFDEGLYTLHPNSIYNSQFKIERKYHTRLFLLSKLTDFPIPAAFFYQQTSNHYTWFPKDSFQDSIIDKDKIIEVKKNKEKNYDEIKIMIGQPWQFMYITDNQIKKIFHFINEKGINIYLQHPKENSMYCNSFLDDGVSLISAKPTSEEFLSNINLGQITLYTLSSSVVCNSPASYLINILKFSNSSDDLINSQENLSRTLSVLGKNFKYINLD